MRDYYGAIARLGIGDVAIQALAWLLRSLEIDESKPAEIKNKVLHLRHFNLCFAYDALQDWANARWHLDKAVAYVEAEFGKTRGTPLCMPSPSGYLSTNSQSSADV